MAISLEDGEAQRQTPSLDKRGGLCCGRCNHILQATLTSGSRMLNPGHLERSMLRHQLPNLCLLFISVILQNEGADIQNTSMSWVLLNRVPKYSVPMSNTQALFLSQIPKADDSQSRCIPCKVVLWLSTFFYNRSSDLLLIQNICTFVSFVCGFLRFTL